MGDFQDVFMIILMISTILMTWKLYKSSRADSTLPPTLAFRLPIIGHLHLLAPQLHVVLQKFSLRYGPVFRLNIGSTPCIVISSPELAREIYKDNDEAFLDKPHNSTADLITFGGEGFAFSSYGPYWKFIKKIIMTQLLSVKTLDILLPVRRDEINRFMKNISQKAKVGKPVKIEVVVGQMASNIISRMMTGNSYSKEGDEDMNVVKLVNDLQHLFSISNLSDHIWFLKYFDLQGIKKTWTDIEKRFDTLMDTILKDQEEAVKQKTDTGEVKNLLSILLEISKDGNMEIKLTKENMKALVLEMFFAGTETSSKTVEWALAELINNPNIMKKAVEEIDQVVGKNRLLQESDIPNLPYLQQIVKETLRLHPPASLNLRLSRQDCTIGGYYIPAKTTIILNLWSLGRDPNYWENPLEFRPERFEGKHTDVRGQHFQLLPFGSGRRMCPGISIGLIFSYMTIGSMIQCFTWKVVEKDGNLTSSVDLEEGVGTPIPLARPLICVPTARLDPIKMSL